MEATITSLSSRRRQAWTTVTVPRILGADLGPEATFHAEDGDFRAVRGRTSGLKTVYRIRADFEGYEKKSGVLLAQRHPDATQPFAAHEWVTDDLAAMIPTFGCRTWPDGVDHWDRPLAGPTLIDSSAAHQRWYIRRWIPEIGMFLDWWGDVLHNDPVVPFFAKFVWSDRNDGASNKRFDFFAMKAGEYAHFDFEKRHNILGGIRDNDGFWGRILTHQPVVLNDGSGLPLSGSMLAFVSIPRDAEVVDPEDDTKQINRDIESLHAATEGPTYGVCHDWDGYWLSNENAPRFKDLEEAAQDAAREWNSFDDLQKFPADFFADRPAGSARSPGQTGDQEDFGATKGTYPIVLKDPRFLHLYKYAIGAELFRGYHHHEADGSKVTAANHPQWVTWSTATHYSTSVSPDRLGKNPEEWGPPGTGYWGHDDQHYTYNNLAAYLALSDDPAVEDILAHRLEADRASYRNRFGGTGATRAQGRQLGAWAHFVSLFDGPERQAWVALMNRRIQSADTHQSLDVAGPLKVLTWGGPDGRKQVYDPATNQLGSWTSLWELGLALVGLYNAHKVNPSEQLTAQLTKLSETMVNFGFFEEEGTFYTTADLLYRSDGEAPEMSTTSRQVTYGGGGGVTSWTFAGILVAREFLGGGHPRFDEVSRYIRAVTGNQEAEDRRTAEWWAAVRGIVFVPPAES